MTVRWLASARTLREGQRVKGDGREEGSQVGTSGREKCIEAELPGAQNASEREKHYPGRQTPLALAWRGQEGLP